jgi:hypothetical protein
VEHEVGPRPLGLLLEPRAVADVAQDVLEAREAQRALGVAVGGQRRLVAVDDRDQLGLERGEQARQRAADRARRRR